DGVVTSTIETPVLPEGTFAYCSSLETTLINPSITTIGVSAFDHDRVFKNLIFEEGQTGIQLINNITSTGSRSFYLCVAVDELVLGENLATLGSYCFYGMINFVEYEVPNTIQTINEGAFGGWSSLQKFTIPFVGQSKNRAEDGIEGTLGWMFGRVKEAETNIAGTTQYYNHQVPYNYYANAQAVKDCAVFYIPRFPELIITDATMLGGGALFDANFIKELTLPNTLKTIYQHALAYCSGLTSLVIPNSVTSIRANALAACNGLKELTIPFVGTSRGGNQDETQAFSYIFGRDGAGKNTSISYASRYSMYYMPYAVGGMTSVSNSWSHFVPTSLTKVYVEDDTTLNARSFYNVPTIRELYISNTLTELTNGGAFFGMSALNILSIPFVGKSRGSLGANGHLGYMFGTNTSGVVQNYSASASSTYYKAPNLKTLIINDETVLSYGAIMNYDTLTKVTLNEGLKTINDRAFDGCTGLTTMVIPNTVETIESKVFDRCSNLTSLIIPFVGHNVDDTASLNNEFGRWFGTASFTGSTAITQKSGTYYVPTKLTNVEITNAKYLNDYA
ncbi:MAG: leucine-rich repeat domain-containing protein, partial [Anaeroplasmataceae bacterium]|nr:leucine-rich repeat domain-containing protein [Anaeroplasmataceae bacterium]